MSARFFAVALTLFAGLYGFTGTAYSQIDYPICTAPNGTSFQSALPCDYDSYDYDYPDAYGTGPPHAGGGVGSPHGGGKSEH